MNFSEIKAADLGRIWPKSKARLSFGTWDVSNPSAAWTFPSNTSSRAWEGVSLLAWVLPPFGENPELLQSCGQSWARSRSIHNVHNIHQNSLKISKNFSLKSSFHLWESPSPSRNTIAARLAWEANEFPPPQSFLSRNTEVTVMRVCTRNRLILSRWMIHFLVNHTTSSAFDRRNLELFTLKLIFSLGK